MAIVVVDLIIALRRNQTGGHTNTRNKQSERSELKPHGSGIR